MAFLKARGHTGATTLLRREASPQAAFVFVRKTKPSQLAASFLTGRRLRRRAQPVGARPSPRVVRAVVRRRPSPRVSCPPRTNDMGGSIRVPERLRPRRAQAHPAAYVARSVVREYWAMLTHEHVVTRSVARTAAILDCTAGVPGDPYTAATARSTVRRGGRRGPGPAAHRLAHRPTERPRLEPRWSGR
jgi:hypothetical protein